MRLLEQFGEQRVARLNCMSPQVLAVQLKQVATTPHDRFVRGIQPRDPE
jgi:hypothetical protein